MSVLEVLERSGISDEEISDMVAKIGSEILHKGGVYVYIGPPHELEEVRVYHYNESTVLILGKHVSEHALIVDKKVEIRVASETEDPIYKIRKELTSLYPSLKVMSGKKTF